MGSIDFGALGDNLVDSIRTKFAGFLHVNQDVDDFVIALGRRYAVLAAAYHLAADEASREEALKDLRRVENTMELKFDEIAHLTRGETLEQLKAALGVVLNFAIQNLPTVIAMIRR